MEIQFPPEISGAEEFKAGPGDVAMLTFKIRAFPGADAIWNKVISEAAEAAEGEEAGEDEVIKIDPADKQFERQVFGLLFSFSSFKLANLLQRRQEQYFTFTSSL